jgi:dTDP-4-dehydrorhamnose 3,5-epimerase|tara:strand:+ start:1262 stop:1816 length:555 start_codon:yes stop_codon:yes gene_type:complete
MEIERLTIPEVILFYPKKHEDARGYFSETYNKENLSDVDVNLDFKQDNHAFSYAKGTIRGLHFQIPPFDQDKLIRVVSGAIYDVAVDIRSNSPTFGHYVSAIIDSKKWNQILVPSGFAHGLCTLEPNTEVIYKVNNYYSHQHDKGILWNDPEIDIDWPVPDSGAVLSEKDLKLPLLSDLPKYFI